MSEMQTRYKKKKKVFGSRFGLGFAKVIKISTKFLYKNYFSIVLGLLASQDNRTVVLKLF
jgi:hypothetical protein